MKHRNAHQDEAQARRMRVLETRCVPIRIGDIWNIDGYDVVRVISFERKITYDNGSSVSQDANSRSATDDERFSIPWPLIKFQVERDMGIDFLGAPGFMFATLMERGAGREWDPKKEAIRIREEERKKKEKEDEKSSERGRGQWRGTGSATR